MSTRAKIYDIAFQIGGKLDRTFSGAMLSAQKNIGRLNKQISTLEANQAGVKKFRKLKSQVKETDQELRAAQDAAGRLAREIKNTAKPSKTLTHEFARMQTRVKTLKGRLLDQRTEVAKLSRKMGAAGISTRRLASDNADLERQLNRARLAQQRLNTVMAKKQANARARDDKRGQLFDAAAAGGTIAMPMMFAGRFEQAMAEVRAISGASATDLVALTDTARQLGATTSFSAAEAAGGMKFLAMAGFKTNQVIAAMPGVLDMAKAGASDLAVTSDIASNILSGFGLEAGQMTRVADVLTKTFTTSNVNLEELGDTMKYVGPVATKAGLGLEDMAAMTGLLGNVGIKGSQAGTSLKAMILRLAAPTGAAADALAGMGIEALDAEGNIRPMVDLLKEVAAGTKNMGSGEQLGVFKNIFGEEPASAVAELVAKAGDQGITEYLNEIKKYQGTAKQTAQIMDDTLFGSVKRLASAGEGLAIVIGGKLTPTFRPVIDSVTWLTARLISLTNTFPKTTSGVGLLVVGTGALSVAMIAGGYAFTVIRGGVLGFRAALAVLNASCLVTRARVLALSVVQKAGAAATGIMTAAQWAFNVALNANPIGLVVAGVAALAGAAVLVYKYWEPISGFFTGIWEKIKAVFGKLVNLVKFIPGVRDKFADLDRAMDTPAIAKVGAAGGIGSLKSKDVSMSVTQHIKVVADGADAAGIKRAVAETSAQGAQNIKGAIQDMMHQDRRLAYE